MTISIENYMRFIVIFLFCLPLFLSCSPNKGEQASIAVDTIPMMVMQIQKHSKLYTAEYVVHKIITHDDQMKLEGSFMKKDFKINLPLGQRKIAIPMDATLKAYVDFNQFSEKNVIKHGNKIEIVLPDPKISLTATRINYDEVKQYVALTRRNFNDEELTSYAQQGREAIIKDIPSMGLVDMARESSARALIPIIEKMGYAPQNITISFRKDFSLEDIKSLIDKTPIEHGTKEE